MKIETMFCDRCGKECEKSRTNHGFHIYKPVIVLADVHNYEKPFDLCQDCYNSLAKWMKAGKEDSDRLEGE